MRAHVGSNIFVYASGAAHPSKAPCGRVLRSVAAGRLDANTRTEVVQEILYVLGRRGDRERAAKLSGASMELFPELPPVTAGHLRKACGLYVAHGWCPSA